MHTLPVGDNSNNIDKAKDDFCTSVVPVERCQSKPPSAVLIQAHRHQLSLVQPEQSQSESPCWF